MSEKTIRRSGLLSILAALSLLLAFYLGELLNLPESSFLIFGVVVSLLLLAALPGLRAAQAGRDGALGGAGLSISVIALAILTILFLISAVADLVLGQDPEEAFPDWLEVFFPIGFFGAIIGLLIFGIAAIKANVFPRWGAILFAIGLPVGLAIDMATGAFFEGTGTTPEVGFYLGPPLFAIGLIWLGDSVWSGRTAAPASTGDATT